LVLTDVSSEAGGALAEAISSAGAPAVFVTHDVTDEVQWAVVIKTALDHFGKIDVLVNSAGIGEGAPLLETSLEHWRRTMAINADGTFLGVRAVGQVMSEAGKGGSIINISSILGKVGQAGAGAYCASKGAVLMLTKAAAIEWAPLGIRVNSVHPGYIETPMVANAIHNAENGNEMRDQLISRHPLGRMGVPREIADGVVFLASDESSFMTGAELVIDGGYTAA
jgi:NAD(P)-dependent dehydrogenase (short-subunit alcohol dehydrogenase family)